MIPGLASSSATFAGLVEYLAPHFRCYQLTLAGFTEGPPIARPLLAEAQDQIYSHPRVRAMRAASTRLAAPSFEMASER